MGYAIRVWSDRGLLPQPFVPDTARVRGDHRRATPRRDAWTEMSRVHLRGACERVVVRMFEGGPLAGWLRVHDDASGHDPRGLPDNTHRLRHSALAGASGARWPGARR